MIALVASLIATAPDSAELPVASSLGYTGGQQTYKVPAGVTWLAITAAGAPGWDTTTNQTGSVGDNNDGYEVFGDLAVTPGEQLFAEIGGAGLVSGAATFDGGGAGGTGSLAPGGSGGGASDVRTRSVLATSCPGGISSLSSRLIVGAGGGGSGGNTLGSGPTDFINSDGGDGRTEGQPLSSCATETLAAGTVIEGGEAYGGNTVAGYTPASGGTDTAGGGSTIPSSTFMLPSQPDCTMSGSVGGANGGFGVGGAGGSGNSNGGGGGGGRYFGGGGGGSGRVASGNCSSPPPPGIAVGGGTGSSFLSSSLVDTEYGPHGDDSGTETNAAVTLQPLIELTSPVNGAFYTKGQVVRAVFDCYSASYPPSYCAGTEQGPGQTEGTSVVSGAAIDTGTPGAHTFTVRNASPFGSSNIQTTITYNVSGGSPPKGLTTGSASISGATGKHPKLTVKVHAARGGSPITKISIRAPAGISFVKGALKRGVSVSGGAKVSVSHRALVVKLKHAASAVTIHVASKALALSKQLRTKVRKHKLKHVIFVVDANLANGTIAELSPVVRL